MVNMPFCELTKNRSNLQQSRNHTHKEEFLISWFSSVQYQSVIRHNRLIYFQPTFV